jgi:lipopolysaccharide export system protein LptC
MSICDETQIDRASMSGRIILLIFLVLSAVGSGWLMNRASRTDAEAGADAYLDPDYYMEDFTTVSMGEDGAPLNKLYAVYMEHNPVDDTLELYEPRLEIFRANNEPLFITAEKGWATDNNEVVLLRGKVRLWEQNRSGDVTLDVETTEVRVLLLEEYAETDQNATIVAKGTTVTGRGVRAHFDESRLEILFHEQTVITQPDRI